ncbi:MAG TPA: bile acid:sodium symporter family protein [Candidatus Paceibacterota bacterium]|nr:bile acid:sodium symporter family protein [Verrucomicrobiota bacterium]HRY48736.1 bile acid:sodium symporter family protein [Candidatus Paceibacterota bacterium]
MEMLLVLALGSAALIFTRVQVLKSYAFTLWVFACVAASMVYPSAFGTWFGFDLKHLIVPLIQIIMFGMGTTLSVADFSRVLTMPWAVVVGMVLQYTVMPFVGFGLTVLFGFEPEIAAGMVLIGSAPGGVASNVINYLARCNVALSVTMTAFSTLISPLMTPAMMKLLAGQYIEISYGKMMVDIFNMIIVPIVAGLVANRMLYGESPGWKKSPVVAGLIAGSVLAAVGVSWIPAGWLGGLRSGLIVGFAMIGVTALAKLIMDIWIRGPKNWMDRALPVLSMAAICWIIAIITARSGEDLKRVGVALLAASMLHNVLGYFLGYWGARACRLSVVDARTVAVEVGMQNGGMASGLAMNTLQSAKAALAPAVFGPWQNVSGSILATWWRGRPAPDSIPISPKPSPTDPR